jgi:diguanylate cyclase (GGDEF)-like protein/PAS domain S-box-containing protein
MNSTAPQVLDAAPTAWWARLHAALMPDYNRKATAYWWAMVALGALTLLYSVRNVAALPAIAWAQIAAGALVAMLAGVFPVRIPRSKNSFAAGEIFIFLLLLLHGPAAATLASAGEALVGSWRTSKRWTSRIVSPAMAAVAMFASATVLQWTLDAQRSYGLVNDGMLLVASMVFAVAYFVLNTLLVTMVPHLKRNEPLRLRELLGSFGWVGVAYAGSASVAALLFLTFQQSGIGVLMAAAPIIALLLATLHFFFRQQEADEAIRKSRNEAVEREAEQSARHVRELEVSERRFHSAFTHASIGMALVGFDGRILQGNLALRTLLGVAEAELAQHDFNEFVGADDVAVLRQHLARVHGREIEAFEIEIRCRHRDGSDVWAAVHCSFFSEPGSAAPCLILQVQDITARRRAEADLHHIAFHDSLTGLPNRRRFHELLSQAIERGRADPQRQFSVMFLDFDRFKLINDSLGHNVGDEFLVQVSQRIRDSVRPKDVVARLGGDEFAVLTEDNDVERYAPHLAERLLDVMRQPLHIADTDITTSASIGITFSRLGYASPEDMLRDADIAMYKAKVAGKARYALFDVGLHTEVSNRLRMESELRNALAAGQLSVAYQPLFDLAQGKLTGFEALCRWTHPELGAVSPAAFIPIAEETGLMVPITDFVLRSACQQLKAWQLKNPAFADLTMQINISGNDLAHSGFLNRITRALVEARLLPQHLTLELTENILMERLEGAMPMLTELRALGIGLSVDDFGTGYSSLSHLSSLPIDSLKIDRSFVRDLHLGSNESAVVRAIVLLGNSLGKSIIAEGIETDAQLTLLREMGCGVGQGFHLARPLAPEVAEAMLERIVVDAAHGRNTAGLGGAVLMH